MKQKRVALFCNLDFPASHQASRIVESCFSCSQIIDTSNFAVKQGTISAALDCDLIISIFNSKRIIDLKSDQLNFNIHAGPPWLRGVGTYARAVYQGNRLHGVTAHKMTAEYDAGKIIGCDTFSIESMSAIQVAELAKKKALELLNRICSYYVLHSSLTDYESEHQWSGDLVTNTEFFNWLENVTDFNEKDKLLQVFGAFSPRS